MHGSPASERGWKQVGVVWRGRHELTSCRGRVWLLFFGNVLRPHHWRDGDDSLVITVEQVNRQQPSSAVRRTSLGTTSTCFIHARVRNPLRKPCPARASARNKPAPEAVPSTRPHLQSPAAMPCTARAVSRARTRNPPQAV